MNVYDFDNTIYRGESTFDLFLFYIKRCPSLIKMFPTVVKALLRYKQGKVTLDEMITRYAPMVEAKILDVVDFENDPAVFWDAHMHKIKPFYKDLQRPDDLIITASPDFNIQEICKRLGINNYLTSKINCKSGKIELICARSNKIKAFFDAYPDCEIDNFYTDSPKNDKPLIDISKHAFVIKGEKITQIK